jgi:hypothetical protein
MFIFHQNLTIIMDTYNGGLLKGVYKKGRTFAIKTLLLILRHYEYKHLSLQNSPLYWRYAVPNASSIVGILTGTHFL